MQTKLNYLINLNETLAKTKDGLNSITYDLLQYVLDYDDEAVEKLHEIIQDPSCIKHLRYTKDTQKFFDKHYEEIEKLRLSSGFYTLGRSDLKSEFVCFACRAKARELYTQIEELAD